MSVDGGHSNETLVRINKEGNIPVYVNKSYIEKYSEEKVPDYIKERLNDNVLITAARRQKDIIKKEANAQISNYIGNCFDAFRELDGFYHIEDPYNVEYSDYYKRSLVGCPIKLYISKKIDNYTFSLTIYFSINKRGNINHEYFEISRNPPFKKDTTFTDYIFPDKEADIFIILEDNYYDRVFYSKMPALKKSMSKDEIKKSLNNYIKNVLDYIISLTEYEEI